MPIWPPHSLCLSTRVCLVCEQFRNRAKQLKADLDTAEVKHLKERTLYHKMSDSIDRSQAKVDTAKATAATGPKAYLSLKVSQRELI